jgi:hypothetical protein
MINFLNALLNTPQRQQSRLIGGFVIFFKNECRVLPLRELLAFARLV